MESIWDDVRFDRAAATAAVEALRRAAAQLDEATQTRAGEAKNAQQDWSGAHRTEFDQQLGTALAEAGQLVAALRRAAGSIEEAAAAAAAEQQRREQARAEFNAQPFFS